MICFKTSRGLLRTGTICFLFAFTLCTPTFVLAQNEEFQSFKGPNTTESIRTQIFESWAISVGFGMNFPTNDFQRAASGGALYQAGLRLRVNDTRHFHLRYTRAEMLAIQRSWVWPDRELDLTMNQYHFLHGWHGNTGFTSSSWTFFELGPAILHTNSDPDGIESISLALSLNLGMLVPVGEHLDFEFGATALINLTDPDFGNQWGAMGQIYAGLQFH